MRTTHLDNQPVNRPSEHDNAPFEAAVKRLIMDVSVASTGNMSDQESMRMVNLATDNLRAAHQAALAARDAEWVAAINAIKPELSQLLTDTDENIVRSLLDTLLAKFKGGK